MLQPMQVLIPDPGLTPNSPNSLAVESRIHNGRHGSYVERTIKKTVDAFGDASRVSYRSRVSDHETWDVAIVDSAMNFPQLLLEDIGQATALEVGALAPLVIEHGLLRCQDLLQVALNKDNAIVRRSAFRFGG